MISSNIQYISITFSN